MTALDNRIRAAARYIQSSDYSVCERWWAVMSLRQIFKAADEQDDHDGVVRLDREYLSPLF